MPKGHLLRRKEGQTDMKKKNIELEGYYLDYYKMYINADPELRQKAKQHWLTKHQENLDSDRYDLIMFSAGMLCAIFAADRDIAIENYNSL